MLCLCSSLYLFHGSSGSLTDRPLSFLRDLYPPHCPSLSQFGNSWITNIGTSLVFDHHPYRHYLPFIPTFFPLACAFHRLRAPVSVPASIRVSSLSILVAHRALQAIRISPFPTTTATSSGRLPTSLTYLYLPVILSSCASSNVIGRDIFKYGRIHQSSAAKIVAFYTPFLSPSTCRLVACAARSRPSSKPELWWPVLIFNHPVTATEDYDDGKFGR